MNEKTRQLIEVYRIQVAELLAAARTLQQVITSLEETEKEEKKDEPQTESR